MFSSNPERDAREIRVIEQQRVFYPNSRTEASWGGVDDRVGSLERPPVGYERTVRREYKKTGIDMKFLIPALILGLAIASGALASDHMGSSIGDRISYGVNNLSDRFSGGFSWLSSFFIPRQAPLSERMMRKAKYGAYDAKNKLSDIGGRLVDTASDAQDRLWETKDRLWDSKDSMMDRARDLYDDYEHDLVRRPMRRLRRALPIKRWTFMTLFSMIPWVPLLLGALAFFGLRPLINEWRSRNVHDSDIRTRSGDVYSRGDMYRTTNSSSLSNRFLSVLALVLNKIGDFLFRTGRDIREADSFRNLKPAVSDYRSSDYSSSRPSDVTYRSDIHRPVDTTTHDFSRSSDLHRPVVDSSAHHSTLSSSSDLPRTSNMSYAPIISSHSNSHPISNISTSDSLPSSTVPASKLSSGVSSDVMEPRVSSSGVAWTVPPVEPIKTFHTVSVKPVDPALLEKYGSDGTLQQKDVSTFKSEGEQPRMLGH